MAQATPTGTPAPTTPGQAVKNVAAFGRVHRAWHRALNVHQKWSK